MSKQAQGYQIIVDELPENFPTHRHDSEFWEHLDRTIATFGFLEEMLGKAIFILTGTKEFEDEAAAEAAFENWQPVLEAALTDVLSKLISSYEKAVRDHQSTSTEGLEELLDRLKKANDIRNVLCHGSWKAPNEAGKSVPRFVNRRKEVFDTPVDISFLKQTRQHVGELACDVMNTVTQMGYQFPGSKSPGKSLTE